MGEDMAIEQLEPVDDAAHKIGGEAMKRFEVEYPEVSEAEGEWIARQANWLTAKGVLKVVLGQPGGLPPEPRGPHR